MSKTKFHYTSIVLSLTMLVFSCADGQRKTNEKTIPEVTFDSVQVEEQKVFMDLEQLPDTAFIKMQEVSDDFFYDMRYATANNFLKETVYDCDNCWLRVQVAKALLKANQAFMEQGYQIKFFDCFRPRAVQYKMWEILPDGRYVANPERGSIHNRGAAVDISLVSLESGNPLNMGTDFDFFGQEAYHDFTDLDDEVVKNRQLLKEVMEENGFKSIRTEWWHYNFAGTSFRISDQELCDE